LRSEVWIATSRSPAVVPVGGTGTGLVARPRASSLEPRKVTVSLPPGAVVARSVMTSDIVRYGVALEQVAVRAPVLPSVEAARV
jgi:hypothetical protein